MKKYNKGYTAGVYDMFHIGHLNILKNSKDWCNELIVGVSTDEVVEKNKNKKPIIPFEDRIKIVQSIKYVDKVVIAKDRDKIKAFKKYKFDYLIMGDDWKNTDFYNDIEKKMKVLGVKVVYFPYTKNISSSKLRIIIDNNIKKIQNNSSL